MNTANYRYSLGGDEHLFVEISDSMSLHAFFKSMMTTSALKKMDRSPRRGLYRKSRYHKLNQPSKLASLSFLRRLRASSR